MDDRQRQKRKVAAQAESTSSSQPAAKKQRVTPAEEIANTLGIEILTAETQLDEYDITKFTPQARLIIVLGKRNTGKTVFMTDFLYHNRHLWAYGLVFTRTKHNGYWQQYVPNHCIISKFDEGLLRRWMHVQMQRVTMDGVNSRIVLILDDMAADHAMRYADIISEIAYNGRHLQIDIIYATQDIVKATTVRKMPEEEEDLEFYWLLFLLLVGHEA